MRETSVKRISFFPDFFMLYEDLFGGYNDDPKYEMFQKYLVNIPKYLENV